MVGPDGIYDGGVPAIGISIVEATNMEAAVAIAQAYSVSAFAEIGLSEMMAMSGWLVCVNLQDWPSLGALSKILHFSCVIG